MDLTNEQLHANLKSAQNLALSKMGLPASYDKGSFDYTQETTYNKTLAAIIAQYPARFNIEAVTVARDVVAKGYQPLEDPYSVALAAKTFATSVEDTVVTLNEKLNPLSTSNLSSFKWLLILGVAGAVLYVAGPSLFSARKRLTRRTEKITHA